MGAFKKIQYNCRKATFLVDKKLYGKLSFREEVELRIHLAGCDACRLYVKQTQKISGMIIQLFKAPAKVEARLDDDFKERLQLQLDEELNKN